MLGLQALQRHGHHWPEMAKESAELRYVFPQCQEPLDTKEYYSYNKSEIGDSPFLDFLLLRELSNHRSDERRSRTFRRPLI